jgi:hypothetical protein
MKKLLLLLFVVIALNTNAQYITNFAKNVNNKETDGFYYHLPRNIVRVDFVVERTQEVKGKYSSYAKELLNTENFIKENKTTFAIKDVYVNTLTEADPNMVFFLSTVTDEKSKETINVNLELNSEGIIQSFGIKPVKCDCDDDDRIEYRANLLSHAEQGTDYCYLPITEDEEVDEDETESDLKMTDKEIAQSIVDEIKKLRVAYFDLITGYQEVNYGNTINFMIERIKELENKYLAMFLGETSSQTFTKTFYITPEEAKNVLTISKFSDTEGFNAKVGESVKINFTDLSVSPYINKLSKDEIENATYNNKLFYRNSANVTMHVSLGENELYESRLSICQFGNVSLIPINKMKLTFDSNSGQVMSISNEE